MLAVVHGTGERGGWWWWVLVSGHEFLQSHSKLRLPTQRVRVWKRHERLERVIKEQNYKRVSCGFLSSWSWKTEKERRREIWDPKSYQIIWPLEEIKKLRFYLSWFSNFRHYILLDKIVLTNYICLVTETLSENTFQTKTILKTLNFGTKTEK